MNFGPKILLLSTLIFCDTSENGYGSIKWPVKRPAKKNEVIQKRILKNDSDSADFLYKWGNRAVETIKWWYLPGKNN